MVENARITGLVVLAALWLWLDCPAARGQEAGKVSANDLSLEVLALQTLYFLQPTPEQEKALREWAPKTASQPGPRRPGKASAELRIALAALRNALAEEEDDDRIGELSDRLDKLREAQKPELDDEIEMTDEALEEAPRLLRLLSPRQVAAYAGSFADEIPDPAEELVAALGKVRGMDDKKWQDFRGGLPEHLGNLLGGTDAERAAAYRDKIVQLMIVARGLSEDEFKRRQPELEKKARALAADVGPMEVVRHHLEYQLAELLANPRLAAVLEARAKNAQTKAAKK